MLIQELNAKHVETKKGWCLQSLSVSGGVDTFIFDMATGDPQEASAIPRSRRPHLTAEAQPMPFDWSTLRLVPAR